MGQQRITLEMAEAIRAGKAAGDSNNAIAKALRDQFGTGVDRRTIDRWCAKVEGKALRAAPAPAAIPAPPAPKVSKKASKTLAATPAAPDELETLEAIATKLRNQVLAGGLPPRDLAALSSELRQTFAAIRGAKVWRQPDAAGSDADADWVLAKLQSLAAKQSPGSPPIDTKQDTDGSLPRAADGSG